MRALLDVNALLALFDKSTLIKVRTWWTEHGGRLGYLCDNTKWLRQDHVAAALHQPGVDDGCLELLAMGLEAADHEFWPDDISITDDSSVRPRPILGPNQITDVYLLGLAVKNGGQLVTLDRGLPLKAVRGAEGRHLVVL